MVNEDIIKLLIKGDEVAYEAIFKEYYRPLSLFANRYLQDVELSKDLVQEMFFYLFEKKETLNIHTSLKSFLYQSVKNRCLNQLKSSKTHAAHHNVILNSQSINLVEDDEVEMAELEDRIATIVAAMPPQTKRVFEMSRFDGIDNQTIADELNISKRTVETHISSALKRLRENLTDVVLALIIVPKWFFDLFL